MSKCGPCLFRLAAIVNWIVSIGPILRPDVFGPIIGLDPLQAGNVNYGFLLRIWSGMAFLWGIMFWEIARDMRARRRMIKYTWLEKTITAVSVILAFLGGHVGDKILILIIFTDVIWIPIFFFFDLIMRGGPDPDEAAAEAGAAPAA